MTKLIDDISALEPLLLQQRKAFNLQPYPSYSERIVSLKSLKKLLLDNQQQLIVAISKDFGHRSADDTRIGDIITSISGINYTIANLRKWMKPTRKHVGILFQPASAHVLLQPLGVIGIMVPWNYPVFLAMGPLTAALAAGNRAMIKMSEATPNTNKLFADIISQYFDQNQVAIIGGEADVATSFASLKFDHLFFTGSTAVGKLVMKAAAENLVPVTLELGGKSPAIIAPKMHIDTAIERLILGKTLNTGQTCVAPDYIFCPAKKVDELVLGLKARFEAMYPAIKDNLDYTSIVNDRQYKRLQHLLIDAENNGGTVISLNADSGCQALRKMPLTLVLNVSDDMLLMQEEIFGPILPIMGYQKIDEAIAYVNAKPRPLALYIYSFDKTIQDYVMKNTISGGACINDAAFHVANDDLPFGGVGDSGMGSYHGKEGFKTFSHAKAIFSKGRMSFGKLLFPPFGKTIHNLVYRLFIR